MQGKRRILVADPSKVVRSTLAKHLKDDFDVREEHDGESAWQTLVLDASIVAVISGPHLPRADGFELLERLRSNRLHRLSDMPFLLLVSPDEPADRRSRAKQLGVSDLLIRGMSGGEIRQRLIRLIDWEIAGDCGLRQIVSNHHDDAPFPEIAGFLEAAEKVAADCVDRSQGLTLICFGLESETLLRQRFGEPAIRGIGERIARVIRSKTGRRDLMGHHTGSTHVIASPGTSPATCLAFAQRVCRGLSESTASILGQPMQIAVSAGLANSEQEGTLSVPALLAAASRRLEAARAMRGASTVAEDSSGAPAGEDYFSALQEIMRQNSITAHLGLTGLHLMPLMRLLEREFHFGLPLRDMEQHFRQRARNESDTD